MQQVRALDTRSLQNDGGEEKRRRLQLRTVFTEKGKLKNRGVFAPLFFVCGQEITIGEPGLDRRRVPPQLINYPGSLADLSVGEGECPTRRRVPPQLIQSTGVPIDKVNGVKYPTF